MSHFRHRGSKALLLLLLLGTPGSDSVDESTRGGPTATGITLDLRNADGETLLMVALRDGRLSAAEDFIKGGASLHARDEKGQSVLFHAVEFGEISVVKSLLDRGTSPDEFVTTGESLLAYALEEGRYASARLLLDAGADFGGSDTNDTPLIFFSLRPGMDWMASYLDDSGEVAIAQQRDGETFFVEATRRGRNLIVSSLLDADVPADSPNRLGETALQVAVANGHETLVGELVNRGASPNLPHPQGWYPVQKAAQRGDLVSLACLLHAGANPNSLTSGGQTAMSHAIDRGDLAAAKLLLRHRAHVGDALHRAVADGDLMTVKFLLSEEVDPNPAGKDSPLAAAVRNDAGEIASRLLAAGADFSSKGREGQSVLHLAVALGNLGIAELLLATGADPNVPCSQPVSEEFAGIIASDGFITWQLSKDRRIYPLMMAADAGSIEMIQLLMNAGARTDVYTGKYRHWPIGFAARRKNVKAMRALLGVDPENEERWIKVDLSAQQAWLYNAEGKTIFSTRLSSGKRGYRTKTGEFVITNKHRNWRSTVYNSSMPYFQRLSCGDFGFHGGYVPGYPASHGCIRLPNASASKLFKLTRMGDRVVIVK